MKNLITRAITGAVYVLLLVGCTVYSPVTAFLFFSLVALAATFEFGSVVNKHASASISRIIVSTASLILVAAFWLWIVGSPTVPKAVAVYGFLLIYVMLRELYLKAENPLRNWALSLFSQLYIALPFALLPILSVSTKDDGTLAYNWIYPLALFIFLWANDTGAYLSGLTLHNIFPAKLFPRISPKKTWVGSIGGALITVAASMLLWHFFPDTLPLWQWVGFAVVVVFFGTWGDLVESLFKRHLGIKDSGNILPGHGGLLDRFDSSLLAIPATVIYFLLTT